MVIGLLLLKKENLKSQVYLVRRMSSGLQSGGQEVKVPVPWGVIAGREWGERGGFPWLGVHGWLDNAGSFKPWAELYLPCGVRFVSIDYPGHGLSSHLPSGQGYHYLESMIHIQRVIKFLGWKEFGLIGHSMGAGIASLYAATFPEQVKGLVMLDLIKPSARSVDELVEKTRQSVLSRLEMEERLEGGRDIASSKVYPSYEAALSRLIEGANFIAGDGALSEASARVLMERGSRKSDCGTGVVFTRDLRHRIPSLYGFHSDFQKEFATQIKCPHLLLKANDSMSYDTEERNQSILGIYSTNPLYEYKEVEGGHHVHLNSPQNVGPIIDNFMKKNNLSGKL